MHRLPEVVHGGLLDAGLLVVRVRGREIPSAATRARPDLTIVEAVGGPDGCRSEQAQVLQRRRRDERSTRMLVTESCKLEYDCWLTSTVVLPLVGGSTVVSHLALKVWS